MNTENESDKKINVLLVEDNPGDARLVQEILADALSTEFSVTHVNRLHDMPHALEKGNFDIMLLDLSLPDITGIQTVIRAHSIAPHLPLVVMSGIDDEPLSLRAVQTGAQDYLIKGEVNSRTLARTIHYAMERNRLRLELKELNKRQEYLATHDILTGLPNRQLLNDRLSQAIARAKRYKQTFALLFLDIDGFKTINDTFGHTHGDQLLKAVTKRLQGVIRKSDTLARLGGDEFIVMLTHLPNTKVAAQVSQKVLDLLAKPFMLCEQELFISASIGIAVYPDDGTNIELLLKNADAAMYEAKDGGKNTYRYYTEAMNAATLQQLTYVNALRRALEREDELYLDYQPQFDQETGCVIGVEALARWDNPELGQIPPQEFIAIAEENGLVVPLGEYVLKSACQQYRNWREQHKLPPFTVSVNLSAVQFQQPNFAERVKWIIQANNIDPKMIDLELTETIIMKNPDEAINTLRSLKSSGIKISIDDFGTGYSSLSYLKRLPIDTLKIDQSFVRDVPEDKDDATIIKAIIALAHSLELNVIAEGVETEAQRQFLIEQGCHRMQGFFLSRPLSVDDCTDFLKQHETKYL